MIFLYIICVVLIFVFIGALWIAWVMVKESDRIDKEAIELEKKINNSLKEGNRLN
jgi:hypothetical protein